MKCTQQKDEYVCLSQFAHCLKINCKYSSIWSLLDTDMGDIVCQWLSHVGLFATPRTLAHQHPLSMEFSRQEYSSGLPFSSPGDLPDPGIEPKSPALQADSLPSEPAGKFCEETKHFQCILQPLSVITMLSRDPVQFL